MKWFPLDKEAASRLRMGDWVGQQGIMTQNLGATEARHWLKRLGAFREIPGDLIK